MCAIRLFPAAVMTLTLIGLFSSPALAAAPKKSTNPEAQATYKDIQQTLGMVPEFLRAFPENAIAGAWSELKNVQMNPSSAIPGKYKELIGLGVAAQIPCSYCIYFHTQLAKAQGATEEQIKMAIAEAALTRHWSTYFNGRMLDEAVFRGDVGKAIDHLQQQTGKEEPSKEQQTVRTAEEARRDITRTFGFFPSFMEGFPADGLAGAWEEMRAVEMTPGPVPDKYLSLIGLGVAAQIPCDYCVYYDTQALRKLSGASQEEINEGLTVAGIVRHWSTYLNGIQLDERRFRKETDQIVANLKRTSQKSARR